MWKPSCCQLLMLVVIVLLALNAWNQRYDVTAGRGLMIFKHDKWTGQTWVCSIRQNPCHKLN